MAKIKSTAGKILNKKTLILCQICVTAALLTACGSRQIKTLSFSDTAMGTVIGGTMYVSDDTAYGTEVKKLIDSLENDMLSWRVEGSEIYDINAAAGNRKTKVSDSLSSILMTCMDVSAQSDGAFDITIGDVTRLWNIDAWADGDISGDYELPDAEDIKEALKYTGYGNIELSDGYIYIPENMNIDLGAVGKGAALDEIKEYLESEPSVEGAVISVGGSILTYGEKADKTKWKVAIVNPLDTSGQLGVLSLDGGVCVSTSGDYERYVEVSGKRYHHIMNPATGYPADSGVHSVTIVSESGALSDALSTACFVLGTDRGLELARHYNAEALFVDNDGNIIMTDGMQQLFSQ
jgi:thiamine biosynthesis lipoprotein